MKRKIALLLVMTFMLFSLPVTGMAAEQNGSTDPGITPDSWLYGLDNFMKELNILITHDTAQKAELMYDISEERLAEAKKMVEENKEKYSIIAMKAYKDSLERAAAILDDAIVNEKNVDDVIEKFNSTFKNHQELVQFIVGQFPEDIKSEINASIDDAIDNIVISIDIADNGAWNYDISFNDTDSDSKNEEDAVDSEEDKEDVVETEENENDDDEATEEDTIAALPLKKVITAEKLSEEIDKTAAELYTSGQLNARQILVVHSLAKQTGKSFDEVLEVFISNGKGIGATAKALGLTPKTALKGINGTFKEVKKQIQDDFKKEKSISHPSKIDKDENKTTINPKDKKNEPKVVQVNNKDDKENNEVKEKIEDKKDKNNNQKNNKDKNDKKENKKPNNGKSNNGNSKNKGKSK